MPLPDEEIKELLEKAEFYMNCWKNSPSSDNLSYVGEALRCYNEIIQIVPEPFYLAQRSNILFILNSWGKGKEFLNQALEDINKAIKLDSDKAFYYYLRAIILFRKRAIVNIFSDEKEKLLAMISSDCKFALHKDPSNFMGWVFLLACDILTDNWDNAISDYGSAKPYAGNNQERLLRSWLGCSALTLAGDPVGEEDKAPLFDQAADIECDELILSVASYIRSYLNVQEEGYSGQKQKILDIQKLFITHLKRWFDKAIILQNFGCYEESISAFSKEIEINPNFVQAWYRKGEVLVHLHRYKEALEVLDKALELRPTDGKAWEYKRQCLEELCLYDQADKAVDKMIQYNFNLGRCWYIKGRYLYDHLKDYERAIKAFDKALESEPDHPGALDYKNRCMEEMELRNCKDINTLLAKLNKIREGK